MIHIIFTTHIQRRGGGVGQGSRPGRRPARRLAWGPGAGREPGLGHLRVCVCVWEREREGNEEGHEQSGRERERAGEG